MPILAWCGNDGQYVMALFGARFLFLFWGLYHFGNERNHYAKVILVILMLIEIAFATIVMMIGEYAFFNLAV